VRRVVRSYRKPHRKELSMNEDQVKGRIKTAKGDLKVIAGKAVGNRNLIEKGKGERAVGKIQAGYGDLKKKIESDK
jgi:uncharacterized protein YjbJ (UPF0337 family)